MTRAEEVERLAASARQCAIADRDESLTPEALNMIAAILSSLVKWYRWHAGDTGELSSTAETIETERVVKMLANIMDGKGTA
jgi:hypothetical protein